MSIASEPCKAELIILDTITEFVMERIAFCDRKTRIRRLVSILLYGHIETDDDIPLKMVAMSSFESILKKAREILHQRLVISSQQARTESIAFYEEMMSDIRISSKSKIRARENLDKLMGVTVGDGTPVDGAAAHQKVDLDKLDLTLLQRKQILEGIRAGS